MKSSPKNGKNIASDSTIPVIMQWQSSSSLQKGNQCLLQLVTKFQVFICHSNSFMCASTVVSHLVCIVFCKCVKFLIIIIDSSWLLVCFCTGDNSLVVGVSCYNSKCTLGSTSCLPVLSQCPRGHVCSRLQTNLRPMWGRDLRMK